jgi:hypothetical protein
MDCPRCGDGLERYALFGREAYTCESCGYVDVPVEHEPEPREGETWTEALERFRNGE